MECLSEFRYRMVCRHSPVGWYFKQLWKISVFRFRLSPRYLLGISNGKTQHDFLADLAHIQMLPGACRNPTKNIFCNFLRFCWKGRIDCWPHHRCIETVKNILNCEQLKPQRSDRLMRFLCLRTVILTLTIFIIFMALRGSPGISLKRMIPAWVHGTAQGKETPAPTQEKAERKSERFGQDPRSNITKTNGHRTLIFGTLPKTSTL